MRCLFREGGGSGRVGAQPSHHMASVNTDGHEDQAKLEAVSYIKSFIKGVTSGVPVAGNSMERRGGGRGGVASSTCEQMIRRSRAKRQIRGGREGRREERGPFQTV